MQEFNLIEKIKKLTESNNTDNLNIGDDCAVIKNISADKDILVTTDILVENIHFSLDYYSFYDIGYKSAQANISDIICKGANPTNAFISLSIPKKINDENILEWYRGFLEACKPYNIEISGGDTTSSKDFFFISVTLIGTIEKNKSILRSNAKNDDNVYVLGFVGESDLGLKKLLSGNYDYNDQSIKTHLRPTLFYDKWQEIINKYKINSSIDISDGLLQDASHIAENSNKTIEIYESSNWYLVNRFFNNNNKKILKSILTGGEDYAVIFTTSDNIPEENNLIKIGKVHEYSSKYIRFIDSNNKEINFDSLGFVHF
ncbi:thiamine-phosphate kinase [Brachyspira hampsonii]|uniref:Thiamine-monophosphate kinase n=1 Tax=Brachyspira hampsonii 30446 TaxID=1289135 RepID=A0A2U4EXQ7_9SPIR|nr:thiamine-phosphate kinase [Brachyspira hampsonii]EKV58076.1 thiamine monophosphate kinase [Brachyspira hampsonii 30446]MBW5388704.1 thiamine-phosphate kinase [Brachyspira hampsonii]MBW5393581.1 thiamine-phosphate kinase [Brachyspira hampsonii]OEJ19403.1 thiamine-phosphate kinase [Brachyspira hampsonii]